VALPPTATPLVGGRIILVPYDPKWPYLFSREADRVRDALGPDVRGLEHVGSTAVPDLAGEPCVDVLLLIADAGDEDAYLPRLEKAGYVAFAREPGWHEHRVFKGPDVAAHLHVCTEGSAPAARMLAFRDLLRADPAARARYAAAKAALAERRWDRPGDYAAAKAVVVADLLP
jgi:GrpB-like predicted nucleotidyltransferase (UPF0157 family)